MANRYRAHLAVVTTIAIGLAACAPKPEELLKRATSSLSKGDPSSAIVDLKAVLQKQPENGAARAMLGQALAASGDFSGAEIELEKANKLGIPDSQFVVASCQVLMSKGEYQKVVDRCKPSAVSPKEAYRLQMLSGGALMALKRHADARSMFQSALAQHPKDVPALMGVVAAENREKGPEAAKAVLEAASPEFKKQAAYWLSVGRFQAGDGRYADAEASFRTADKLATGGPDSGERIHALGSLAEMQLRQGKISEADETSTRLMRVAPNQPLVRMLRAYVAAAGGKTDEARTLLEDMVTKQSENWDARTLLALVYVQQGYLDQAQMHLQAVVANRPEDVRAQRILAEVRSRLDSPSEALAGVKHALTETSNDPVMLAVAGRMALESGDKTGALQYLDKASATVDKSDAETKVDLANNYLAAGETDRALEILESMGSDATTGGKRDALLLLTLLRKGDLAQLDAQAKAIVAKAPRDARTRMLVGNVYAAAGKPELAREQFTEAAKLATNKPDPWLSLAKLDASQNKLDAAEANFKRALEKDPKNAVATIGLAILAAKRSDFGSAEKLLIKARNDHPDNIDVRMELAKFYASVNQPAKARAVADEAVKAYPSNADMAYMRGMVLMGLKDFPGAITSLEQAVRLEPNNSTYTAQLAHARFSNSDVAGAFDTIDKGLKANPKSIPLLSLGAAMALPAGQTEKGAGYVARIREVAPQSVGTYMLEGDLAMAQKRYGDAVPQYRKAQTILNNSQLAIGEFTAARLAGEPNPDKNLSAWVAANPTDMNAVANLAEYRISLGKPQDARRLYEAALQKDPNNVLALNNMAMLLASSKDPKSVDYAARAYKAEPRSPGIADTYGWALVQQGRVDEGLPVLRAAAAGLPNNAEVQYHLAVALAAKKQNAEAKDLLKKALAGQLPTALKADAQKLLAQVSR